MNTLTENELLETNGGFAPLSGPPGGIFLPAAPSYGNGWGLLGYVGVWNSQPHNQSD